MTDEVAAIITEALCIREWDLEQYEVDWVVEDVLDALLPPGTDLVALRRDADGTVQVMYLNEGEYVDRWPHELVTAYRLVERSEEANDASP